VRNGGFDEAVLVDPEGLLALCGVRPEQYRDYAALRGDPSDNLPGARRFGSATAARLLATFDTVDAAWAAIDAGDAQAVRDVVGAQCTDELGRPETRELVERNRRLMRMRADLPIPGLHRARLPLRLGDMRAALSGRGINFGPSLWALTGGNPPVVAVDPPMPELQPWKLRGGLTSRRDPTPGQLALF
jgi:hypothetical protein